MLITKIQRFSTHDGPGIRTCVFFKGCPLSCFWCHNPENRSFSPDIFFDERFCIKCGACASVCPRSCHVINDDGHLFDRTNCIKCGKCAEVCPSEALTLSGREMTAEEILEVIKADRAFYGDRGGVTLTGGEPLAFRESVDILRLCEKEGIGCCFETSGAGIPEVSAEAASLCWDFFVDIKDGDPERHLKNVGVSKEKLLKNIKLMDENAKGKFTLRAILLKGVNADETNYDYIAEVFRELKNCRGVELVPYHALYGSKYTRLGIKDESSSGYVPGKEDLERAAEQLRSKGVVII
ncbi:MAG: glycyl-radical enzyme activating protein [Clostridia bacterium]|nr:glycyl-radical enzyme activating protein [Clostridia bacterium]